MNPDGVDPGRSTVYVSNLPYDLKPPDIQEIFEKYGRIVKVTLLTVKETRKSKGVAFVLFFRPEDARNCVADEDNRDMFGRVLKICMARDNGRSPDAFQQPVRNPDLFRRRPYDPGNSRTNQQDSYYY